VKPALEAVESAAEPVVRSAVGRLGAIAGEGMQLALQGSSKRSPVGAVASAAANATRRVVSGLSGANVAERESVIPKIPEQSPAEDAQLVFRPVTMPASGEITLSARGEESVTLVRRRLKIVAGVAPRGVFAPMNVCMERGRSVKERESVNRVIDMMSPVEQMLVCVKRDRSSIHAISHVFGRAI